jgi:hypothetical protein
MIAGSVKSMSTNGSSFRQLLTPSSYVTLAVPILVLVIAVFTQNKVLLDYTHVICGGTWTGIDLFMGLVMSRVMRGLAPDARAEVIKRLVPVMLFLMPALASVAITAGIYLAQWEGLLNLQSPWIIAAVILVLILSVQGFGIIMPTEIRLFLELTKDSPDRDRIVKLGMRNIKVSGSQAIFQIAIIFVMANLAMA